MPRHVKSLLAWLSLVSLTACGYHQLARNMSGAEATAELAQRDPLAEKRRNRDPIMIERRAAYYESQGHTAAEARVLAEMEYARTLR